MARALRGLKIPAAFKVKSEIIPRLSMRLFKINLKHKLKAAVKNKSRGIKNKII